MKIEVEITVKNDNKDNITVEVMQPKEGSSWRDKPYLYWPYIIVISAVAAIVVNLLLKSVGL